MKTFCESSIYNQKKTFFGYTSSSCFQKKISELVIKYKDGFSATCWITRYGHIKKVIVLYIKQIWTKQNLCM